MEKYLPTIPEKFEVKNGIAAESLRSVGIKLMYCFLDREKKRSLVGLCKERYEHVKLSKTKFIPPVVNDLSIQNKEDLKISNYFVRIIRCSNYTGWTWAFVDYVLENKTFVYHMNFKSVSSNVFDVGMGVIAVIDNLPYGNTRNSSMHCLYHCDGEVIQNGCSDGNNLWRKNDIVGIEANTLQSTLRFFVNGQLQPVSYSSIPARLRFCVAEECSSTDSYNLDNPNLECARYIHTMQEDRMASWGDEIQFVSFRRFVSQPSLRLPPAAVYDPDHCGYKPRVVEWNYLNRKKR